MDCNKEQARIVINVGGNTPRLLATRVFDEVYKAAKTQNQLEEPDCHIEVSQNGKDWVRVNYENKDMGISQIDAITGKDTLGLIQKTLEQGASAPRPGYGLPLALKCRCYNPESEPDDNEILDVQESCLCAQDKPCEDIITPDNIGTSLLKDITHKLAWAAYMTHNLLDGIDLNLTAEDKTRLSKQAQEYEKLGADVANNEQDSRRRNSQDNISYAVKDRQVVSVSFDNKITLQNYQEQKVLLVVGEAAITSMPKEDLKTLMVAWLGINYPDVLKFDEPVSSDEEMKQAKGK